MKRSLPKDGRSTSTRRGVTLVEMLVTLAVLLIMMTFIVKIFQAATGSLSSAMAYQELDNQLRLLDSTIRSDLNGVTCRLTPPNDPQNNPGYLEYGENEFADIQGEDSDDYIRFTAKAPAGRPFTGRIWVPAPLTTPLMSAAQFSNYLTTQPVTITSEYAEIIYFLRNGNLYRRVLLIAPERQSSMAKSVNNVWYFTDPTTGNPTSGSFFPSALATVPATAVSWQGVNDLSARPMSAGAPYNNNSIILNTLADLTSRENRWAYQRFSSDYQDLSGALAQGGDGLDDDVNGDNVPDYYPTLYPTVLAPVNAPGQLIFEPGYPAARQALGALAFPYVFPGAYSIPQSLGTPLYSTNYGWIHSPEPVTAPAPALTAIQFDARPLDYLLSINHNPLDLGDNLAIPITGVGDLQTWWGFPTWRETLSPLWVDPTHPVNGAPAPFSLAAGQSAGLVSRAPNAAPADLAQFLPAMTGVYRNTPQPYNDSFGSSTGFFPVDASGNPPPLWTQSWEDDLIMTGVRSFDIKALDNSLAQYVDLGWGDDPRLTNLLVGSPGLGTGNVIPYLAGNLDAVTKAYNSPVIANVNGTFFNLLNQTFAHEGRIPPLQNDNRLDASNPNPNYTNYVTGNFVPQYAAFAGYSSNVGDDNNAVVRLRRVWDSWSTEYTKAPATGVITGTGFPAGPPFSPPIYPSYPPPYPAPLRGIQIQIRVTDPTNQRIKTLTIRQDFTDKL